MPLPKKALIQSTLKPVHEPNAAVIQSSHEIHKMSCEDAEKKVYVGYFKKADLEHHYHPIHAAFSAAMSLFYRSFQGIHAAEERLVFDEQDNIVGTFSLDMPFTSLIYAGERVKEPGEEWLAVPTKGTLIKTNMMSVLVARLFGHDPDTHAHNIGFIPEGAAHIDFDMGPTYLMVGEHAFKGSRLGCPDPPKLPFISSASWHNMPILSKEDATIFITGQELIVLVLMLYLR